MKYQNKPCSICNSIGHTKTFCWQNPKTQIRVQKIKKQYNKLQNNKFYQKDRSFRRKWIELNPPDKYGFWTCYLQIHSLCPGRVDYDMLTIEHVIPRGRGVEYRWDLDNVRPACFYCNQLKGSRTLEALANDFPLLKIRLSEDSKL